METKITTLPPTDGLLKRMQQHSELTKKYGKSTIVLFKVGDFYETYDNDARKLTDELGITLSRRYKIETACFPKKAEDIFFAKLVRAGYKLAIIENP